MAKIQLVIDAEDSDDLQNTLDRLVNMTGGGVYRQSDSPFDEQFEQLHIPVEVRAEQALAAAEPAKRSRKVKGQAEPGESVPLAEPGSATSASVTPASTASAAATPGPSDTSTQPAAGSTNPSLEDLIGAMHGAATKPGGMIEVRKIISSYGPEGAQPQASIVPEDKRAEAIAKIEAI